MHGSSAPTTKIGTVAGMRAIIDDDAKHSLLGVGALITLLAPHARYEGDDSSMKILYKDEILCEAQMQNNIPWVSLSDFVDKLKIIQQEHHSPHFVKFMQALTTTIDSFTTDASGHDLRRSTRSRKVNSRLSDYELTTKPHSSIYKNFPNSITCSHYQGALI